MLKRIAFAWVAVSIASPVAAADSRPQAEFTGSTAAEIGARIAAACLDRHWSIAERSDYLVVCAEPEVMLLRTQDRARFNLVQLDGKVRVVGEGQRVVIGRFGEQPAQGAVAHGTLEPAMRELLQGIAG